MQKADGATLEEIAEKQNININSVHLYVRKYIAGGVENALFDAPGRGRNAEITDDEKAWVINIACQRPYDLGLPHEMWSLSRLVRYINENAEAAGHLRLCTVSQSSIQRMLSKAEVKPHKIQYYCEKRDPAFETKMNEVLVVYKQIEMTKSRGTRHRWRVLRYIHIGEMAARINENARIA